ncbi:cytochrome P450 [Pseudonocardia sp. MCCB 268]|nr:cytochrome P450 [Pseudonocardia cytotoxica]
MMILTYAGHDSTALRLSNTLLYLAEHPDVQQRLLDEPKARQIDDPTRSCGTRPRCTWFRGGSRSAPTTACTVSG